MIDPQLLAAAADLCGLRLSTSERQALSADLAQLLDHFASLRTVNTSQVGQPEVPQGRTVSPESLDDAAQPQPFPFGHELLENIGPRNPDGLIIVPKTLDEPW